MWSGNFLSHHFSELFHKISQGETPIKNQHYRSISNFGHFLYPF
jgi:hypothetical protein